MGNTKEIFFEKHLIVKVKNTNFHFVILFFLFPFLILSAKKVFILGYPQSGLESVAKFDRHSLKRVQKKFQT